MSKEQQQTIDALFKELDGYLQDGSYKKALRVCNKILGSNGKDLEAFQCKVICWMQLGNFSEALETIVKGDQNQQDSLVFEKTYCLYSLGKYNDALKEISSIKQKPNKILELEAQIYYKQEEYSKTITIYEGLLNQSQYAGSGELITNLCAVYVDAGRHQECQELINKNKSLLNKTYELAYNAACLSLSKREIKNAEMQLKLSKKICIEVLTKDGLEQSDIDEESSAIDVQLAYCQQLNGNLESSLSAYQNILDKEFGDSASLVAFNNILSVKTASPNANYQSLLDQFKTVITDQTESKLNGGQKKVVQLNHCYLLLHLKKVSQFEEMVKQLKQKNKDSVNFKDYSEDLDLIVSFMLMNNKKWKEAEEILKKYNSLKSKLTLAQLYLLDNNQYQKAIQVLQGLDSALQNKPGVVATMVALYEKLGDFTKASQCLDGLISTLEAKKNKSEKEEDSFVNLLKLSGNFKMKHHKYKEAASMYEKVLSINANDLVALPSYIVATSHFDPTLAQKYEHKLPSIQLPEDSKVDVDAIEILGLHYGQTKPTTTTTPSKPATTPATKGGKTTTTTTATTTNTPARKVPKRLPKNYDPNVLPDPERWLPKWQRTKFRKGGKGRLGGKDALAKGPQGVSSSTAANPYAVTQSTVEASSSNTPGKNIQQVSSSKPKNYGKKKGKKGK